MEALANVEGEVELVLFGDPKSISWESRGTLMQLVDFPYPIISEEAFDRLPRLIGQHDIQVFIGPQFYVLPHLPCPLITFLHDAFPFRDSVILPQIAELDEAFGHSAVDRLASEVAPYLSTIPSRVESGFVKQLYRGMYLASVESAARVITVSNASRIDLLSHFPALQGKLVLLSPFVSSELTDSDAESKLGTGYFLHVGRWEPRKRQNIIVEAFARARVENPELRLVLVGAKCEYYSIYGGNLESLIQQPVADGWLQWRPNITNSELASLYRGAVATILAPLYEGFGLPALEAMSLGCPLVSSGTGALAEVCGSADFRIMGDLESLIAAIQRLSANDSLRRHLSRLGRLRAAVFTQEKFGRGLVAVIKGIASS